MSEWKTIESAPKDGTLVLVYTKWDDYFVAQFYEDYWCHEYNGEPINSRVDY